MPPKRGVQVDKWFEVELPPFDLAGVLRPFALGLHRAAEALDIDCSDRSRHDLLRDLKREPIGIMQKKRHVARKAIATRRGQLAQLDVEDRRARLQRLAESLFFTLHNIANEVVVLGQARDSRRP